MKNLFKASWLLLAVFFVACVDVIVENPNHEELSSTRAAADPEGKDYYWSGGQKNWLDTDYSQMVVGFDNEEQSKKFVATTSNANLFTGKAMALVDVGGADVEQKILADKAVKNKIFAHKLSDKDIPIYLTGEIILQPKDGTSVDGILAEYKAVIETVKKTPIGNPDGAAKWRRGIYTIHFMR